MRQRVAALGEAILVAPASDRDELAMMLIEMASFHCSSANTPDHLGVQSAAGPIELLARIPSRWRQRHADEAMLAIARAWSLLSTPMKELGAGLGRDRWLGAARTLSSDTDPRARLAAVAIAQDTADPGFGKIVGMLLADEHQSVRIAADKAMMRMTMVMLDHLPAYLLGDELSKVAAAPRVTLPVDSAVLALERCILLSAIADAAWSFAVHRCRSPLLAALLVMDRAVATPMEREISGRMRRLLNERNHPSHSPMRTVLRRTPCPILRERALRWVTISPMSTAAIDRLAVADSLDEHEIVLSKSYLGIRPRRSARLASLRHNTQLTNGRLELTSVGPLPKRSQYAQLNEDSRLGLIRFSSLIGIDDQAKRDLLEPTLADPSVHVRLCACNASSMIDLPDFLYDVDSAVARQGALRWSSVGNAPPRLSSPAWKHRQQIAQINARSNQSWVRRIADEESQRLSIIMPRSPASRVQARRLYKNDPAKFVRMMRDQLSNPASRCDAIMLIRLMGIEQRFELDLISMMQTESCDARARATAVTALGEIDTNAARYALSEAMSDTDDRIRANAVESLSGSAAQVLELKADKHHRVRASAIRRSILDADISKLNTTRDAGHALLEMLHDDRPMHRLAATWAAQRTITGANRELMGSVWNPLIAEIESLANDSNDPRIQARANSCIHRVCSDLHAQQELHRQQINNVSCMSGAGNI